MCRRRGELLVLGLSLGMLLAVYETDKDALGSTLVKRGLDQVAGPLPGFKGDEQVNGDGPGPKDGLDWDTRGVVFSPGLL